MADFVQFLDELYILLSKSRMTSRRTRWMLTAERPAAQNNPGCGHPEANAFRGPTLGTGHKDTKNLPNMNNPPPLKCPRSVFNRVQSRQKRVLYNEGNGQYKKIEILILLQTIPILQNWNSLCIFA